MFVRMTHFQCDPANLSDMVSRIDGIKEQLQDIAGGVQNWAVWNDDGTGVAFAVYEDEAAADAAGGQIQAIWGGLADLLTAPPEVKSYSNAARMRG